MSQTYRAGRLAAAVIVAIAMAIGVFSIESARARENALSADLPGAMATTCELVQGADPGHGGGLNACGCHFNRKLGTCHCHRNRGCGCECQPPSCG